MPADDIQTFARVSVHLKQLYLGWHIERSILGERNTTNLQWIVGQWGFSASVSSHCPSLKMWGYQVMSSHNHLSYPRDSDTVNHAARPTDHVRVHPEPSNPLFHYRIEWKPRAVGDRPCDTYIDIRRVYVCPNLQWIRCYLSDNAVTLHSNVEKR